MKIFLVILGTIIGIIVFVSLSIMLVEEYCFWLRRQKDNKRVTRMKVRDLKSIYRINPESVSLGNTRYLELHYKLEGKDESYYFSEPKRVYIYLSFWGYLWLCLQAKIELSRLKHISKCKKKKVEAENMKEILNSCQKRIDVLHDEAAHQIDVARKITEEVGKNMYQW